MLAARFLAAAPILLLLVASLPAPASADLLPQRAWIVGFHALPPGLDVGGLYEGARVETVLAPVRALVVSTPDPTFKGRAHADPLVRYVEADGPVQLLYTPNDPLYPQQYEHAQTRLPDAWNVTLGDPAVKICVLDTGVRHTHEDLAGPRWLGGVDVVNRDDDPWDDNGHGTHVSGIAAATIGNGKGGVGAANVGLLVAKVMPAGGIGNWSRVAEGILWCAEHAGPRGILSMSIGGGPSQAVADALHHAHAEKGLLLVAAAGNQGPCEECVLYPAAFPEVVAVACTARGESLCQTSSRGRGMGLAAPGSEILNACYTGDADYCSKSGTSDAAPLVSGIAALLWSAQPGLTNVELRARLNATAQDLGAGGWDPLFGHGEVDAKCLFENRSPCYPPPHDRLASAEAIPPALPFRKQVSTRLATAELGEPAPCGPVGATVWYSWTAPASGTVTVESHGGGFDTVLAAYAGDLTSLVPLGCDDGDADGGNARSRVRFSATSGMTYALQLGARLGATGSVHLEMTCDACPANNPFGAAARLASTPASRSQTTVGATTEPAEPNPCGPMGATVWHRWHAPGSGTAVVDTLNSDFDTVLAVHTGTGLASLAPVGCNDDVAGTSQSQVVFPAQAGVTYWIQAGGRLGATGRLQLSLQCPDCLAATPNDLFASPEVMYRSAVYDELGTLGATEEPGEPRACGAIGKSVWYAVTPQRSVLGVFKTTGSEFDTVLALHVGDELTNLTQVGCNDDANPGDPASKLTVPLVANRTYRVQVGGFQGAAGVLRFSFQCAPGCFPGVGNDMRANATPIAALPYSNEQDNIDYTTEPDELLPPNMGSTAWYRYVAPATSLPAVVTVDTHGSRIDTVLAAYAGDTLVLLGWNDDERPLTPGPARIRFTALPGVPYMIQVGGTSAGGVAYTIGEMRLNVS